jgi:hypothetical protein
MVRDLFVSARTLARSPPPCLQGRRQRFPPSSSPATFEVVSLPRAPASEQQHAQGRDRARRHSDRQGARADAFGGQKTERESGRGHLGHTER